MKAAIENHMNYRDSDFGHTLKEYGGVKPDCFQQWDRDVTAQH